MQLRLKAEALRNNNWVFNNPSQTNIEAKSPVYLNILQAEQYTLRGAKEYIKSLPKNTFLFTNNLNNIYLLLNNIGNLFSQYNHPHKLLITH